jgi:hypothetical protein
MLKELIRVELWSLFQGQGAVPGAAVLDKGTVMIIEMTIGIGTIGGGVVVGVEKYMVLTGTVKGILNVVAGVPATVLMITGSVGETVCLLHVEALVGAEVAATLLKITRGVAKKVHHLPLRAHLQAGAVVAHLAGHHLLLGYLLPGARMTGLHARGALHHE